MAFPFIVLCPRRRAVSAVAFPFIERAVSVSVLFLENTDHDLWRSAAGSGSFYGDV